MPIKTRMKKKFFLDIVLSCKVRSPTHKTIMRIGNIWEGILCKLYNRLKLKPCAKGALKKKPSFPGISMVKSVLSLGFKEE